MQGDPLKRVASGQPFKMMAKTHNAFCDAAEDFQKRRPGGAIGGVPGVGADQSIIMVKNTTGSALDPYSVLGVNGLEITASDNIDEFKRLQVLTGVTPAADTDFGRFLITQEPINDGEIGAAKAFGTTIVQINVVDANHGFADVADGDETQLQSGLDGGAQILWKDSGTGTKWALVRIGGGSSTQGFWATIGSPTLITSAFNRWTYPFTEIDNGNWNADFTPVAKTGGRTGNCTNGAEDPNGETGLMGCGESISSAEALSGITLLPIGPATVWIEPMGKDCDGNDIHKFYANNLKMKCPP